MKTKTKIQVKESATYRMYVFGAGQPKGGYGGFLFNDLTLIPPEHAVKIFSI